MKYIILTILISPICAWANTIEGKWQGYVSGVSEYDQTDSQGGYCQFSIEIKDGFASFTHDDQLCSFLFVYKKWPMNQVVNQGLRMGLMADDGFSIYTEANDKYDGKPNSYISGHLYTDETEGGDMLIIRGREYLTSWPNRYSISGVLKRAGL